MRLMKLFQHGALIAQLADKEARLANGLIDEPPKLFVSCHDNERDEYKLIPIDWLAAWTLCPKEMRCICSQIASEREARELEEESVKQVAETEKKVAALRAGQTA